MTENKDDPVKIDLDPEVALRALLQVDPNAEPRDADAALVQASRLGIDSPEWTDQVMDEIETLLPALRAAGYVEVLEDRWGFSPAGIKRIEELLPED
jgi:hypothetical protein